MSRTRFTVFVKALAREISRDQVSNLSAQLAYFSILAIFPFVIFVLTLIGYLPIQGLTEQLTRYIYEAMPQSAAQLIDQTMHEVVGQQRGILLIVSLLGGIWTASSGVSATLMALNRAYKVEETRSFWRTLLLSMAMTVAAAFMIIIAVAALILGPDIVHKITDLIGLSHVFDLVWNWVRWPVIVAAMMSMLATVYYFLPNVKQKFRIITPGAVVGVLLWIGASLGFSLYVTHFNSYAKTYGTLGTGIVLLTWLYLSSFMVVLGGEINALLDREFKGVQHVEKFPGPVTKPDRGKEEGEPRERDKGQAA